MCQLSPASPPIPLQEGCFAGNGEQEPALFASGFTKPFANALHLSPPDPPITIPSRKARKEPGMRYGGMLQATTPQSIPGGACGASTVAESRACSARGGPRTLLPAGSGSSGATEPSPAEPSKQPRGRTDLAGAGSAGAGNNSGLQPGTGVPSRAI